jgi:hypothetical protein
MSEVQQFLATLAPLNAADDPLEAAALAQLAIEAWGWQALGQDAYLHLGRPALSGAVPAGSPDVPAEGLDGAHQAQETAEVSVVGLVDGDMQGLTLLWLP